MDTPSSSGGSITKDLQSAQENFEKRFSCPVCLDPKLEMVVSSCQHRICAECLYDENRKLNKAMTKCPTCQRNNAFPETRPDIPEDSIEIQRQLGVAECPMDGCTAGLWMWDVDRHIATCPYAVVSPTKPGSKRKRGAKAKKTKECAKTPKRQKPAPATNSPTTNSPITTSPAKHDNVNPASNAFTPRVTRSTSNLNQNQNLNQNRHHHQQQQQQALLDNPPRWCLRSAPPCSQYFQFSPFMQWNRAPQRGFGHPFNAAPAAMQRPYYHN